MTPSNTNSGITVLRQGVDTLYYSIYGTLKSGVVVVLDESKKLAQESQDGDWSLSPLPPFDGVTPLIHASGVKYYEWHCRSDDVTATIRKPGKSPMPAAIVRVSAQALARLGGGGLVAAALAETWLRPLFEDDGSYRAVVKRVDLAADFQGWAPQISDLAENGPIVKRADGLDLHFGECNALETIAAGRSTDIRLNLYNKARQAKKKGLLWVFDQWDATGCYNASQDVFRLEYQFGRNFLHERGIETLDDLRVQLGALWKYGMGWFSYRTPNLADAEHRYRWPVAPHWMALTPWQLAVADELPRVKVVRPKYHRLVAGLAGYLTSAMAITEEDDPLVALDRVISWRGHAAMGRQLAAKRVRYAGFTMGAA